MIKSFLLNRVHGIIFALAMTIIGTNCLAFYKEEINQINVIVKGSRATSIMGRYREFKDIDFTKNGIIPITIIVCNNSNKPVGLSPDSLRIKLVDIDTVIRLCIFSDKIQMVFAAGLSYVACLYLPYHGGESWWTIAGMALGLMPIGIWGVRNLFHHVNRSAREMLEKCMLQGPVVIQPGEAIEKIVMVDSSSCWKSFSLRIFETDLNIAFFDAKHPTAAVFDIDLFK